MMNWNQHASLDFLDNKIVDASQIDAIDYRTTNSVEILRYKIEHLIAKVIKLEQANETLRSEIEDLNYDIEMLERSVYD